MSDTMWRDSAVIARKPVLEPKQQNAFDARLEKVVCAFRDPVVFSLDPPRHGKWVAKYNATIRATKRIRLKLFIRKLFAGQFVRLNTE